MYSDMSIPGMGENRSDSFIWPRHGLGTDRDACAREHGQYGVDSEISQLANDIHECPKKPHRQSEFRARNSLVSEGPDIS